MSKAPSMPMYWDAYLADTTHLTTEEHGAYMLLLAAMWRRNGAVPDDDKDNARILGLTPAKWRKIKVRLEATIAGLHISKGEITQEKLQKTWKNTQEKIDKNKQNGAKGGRVKSRKTKGLDQADGSETLNPKSSIPEPEPEPYEEDKSSSQKAADYQRFLDAHPNPVESKGGEAAFDALIADGTDPEVIIAAAEAYAEKAKTFSSPNFVQQSDNFLDPERGKWREHVSKSKRATDAEVLQFYADVVIQKKPAAAVTVSGSMANRLLDAEMVTPEQLLEAGVKS